MAIPPRWAARRVVGAANVNPVGHHFIERKFRVSNFQDVRGVFLFDCEWSIPSESILHKAEMRVFTPPYVCLPATHSFVFPNITGKKIYSTPGRFQARLNSAAQIELSIVPAAPNPFIWTTRKPLPDIPAHTPRTRIRSRHPIRGRNGDIRT